jgi:endo-1,4-beta-D-glucanase Y
VPSESLEGAVKQRAALLFFLFFSIVLCVNASAFSGIPFLNSDPNSTFWDYYKKTFLKELPNGTIVVDKHMKMKEESGKDGAIITNTYLQIGLTVSEAMGHALIIAAERSDWGTFDSLLNGLSYFKKSNGLYRWIIYPDGKLLSTDRAKQASSETEQNIAFALFVAYEKTNNEKYKQYALDLLGNIWLEMEMELNGRSIILPADADGNAYWPVKTMQSTLEAVWNPSYFSPRFYRKFAQYDKEHDWNKVIKDGYFLMNKVLDRASADRKTFGTYGQTDPMPAWVWLVPSAEGSPDVRTYYKGADETNNEWDSIRIPIYIGLDAKSTEGKLFLTRFYQIASIQRPEDAKIGGIVDAISVGSYGAGLSSLGRDPKDFLNGLIIGNNGFVMSVKDAYYDQTITYYGYLVMTGKFPYNSQGP